MFSYDPTSRINAGEEQETWSHMNVRDPGAVLLVHWFDSGLALHCTVIGGHGTLPLDETCCRLMGVCICRPLTFLCLAIGGPLCRVL